MRRPVSVVVVVFSLSVAFVGAVALLSDRPAVPRDDRAPEDIPLVALEGSNNTFYPYLSAHRGPEKRSPINVIVRGATADDVLRLFKETGWNATSPEGADANFSFTDAEGGTGIAWGQARGSNRYAYVHDGTQGRWVSQTYQVNDGEYFGRRFHLRLYDSPVPGDWVLVQAHSEHFDWFTLRHAVHGVAEGQRHVEADFLGQPFVRELSRTYLGNVRSDGDGWATVIELAVAMVPLLVGLATTASDPLRLGPELRALASGLRRRLSWDHLLLGLAIVGLVLGVRGGGVLLDRHAPGLSVKAIPAILFPLLTLGVPLAAFALAHRIERRMDAAVVASLALASASLLDYILLHAAVVPIDVLVHRVGLVFAVGLLAAGGARRAHRVRHANGLALSGAVLWVLLVCATLFGWF